jgi:hypothetical protein
VYLLDLSRHVCTSWISVGRRVSFSKSGPLRTSEACQCHLPATGPHQPNRCRFQQDPIYVKKVGLHRIPFTPMNVDSDRTLLDNEVSSHRTLLHNKVNSHRTLLHNKVNSHRTLLHNEVSSRETLLHNEVSSHRTLIHNEVSSHRTPIYQTQVGSLRDPIT